MTVNRTDYDDRIEYTDGVSTVTLYKETPARILLTGHPNTWGDLDTYLSGLDALT